MEQTISHPFPPIYNSESRILILGSFPSVVSRAQAFYYGHPRNRFWPLLATLLNVPEPYTIEEKKQLLLQHHIALSDAVGSCTVTNSSDSSIHAVVPADLSSIFRTAAIQAVFANGNKAYTVCTKQIGIPAVQLPSTSPANARFRFDDLLVAWKVISAYL